MENVTLDYTECSAALTTELSAGVGIIIAHSINFMTLQSFLMNSLFFYSFSVDIFET